MSSIEERLRQLEDESAILQTLHAYAHCLDYGDEAGFLDCFHEEATLHWSSRGAQKGHAMIREGFRWHTHAPAAWHKHFLVEPRIDIAGDTAKVESMYTRLDRYESGPEFRSFGRYRDTFVRCKDGRWRFMERHADQEARRAPSASGAGR